MAPDLAQHIEAVARSCWGEPNAGLSKPGRELRWGRGGSKSCDLNKGTWYDHEADEGGGVLDLLRREKGVTNGAAFEWMRASGILIEDHGHRTPSAKGRAQDRGKLTASYDYVDEVGNLVSQTLRFERPSEDGGKPKKTFSQRRPDGGGGWVSNLKDARLIPYRLPELQEAIAQEQIVFAVEGEKAVDRLWNAGVPATCNAMGAKKWPASFAEFFGAARVAILPDNDDAGRDHASMVAANLLPVAADVRIVALPGLAEKEDIVEWLDLHGGTVEGLYDLVERAPVFDPSAPPPFKSRFRATWFREIDAAPPKREWIIKGIMPTSGFSLVYGQPKCGKSFLVLDMTLTAALAGHRRIDEVWFGHRVRPAGAIYIAAEGEDDVGLRIRAWRDHKGLAAGTDLPFVLLPTRVDLRSPEGDIVALIQEVKAHRAHMPASVNITVDTVARAMAAGDENSPVDMGQFIKNCDRLAAETGCHVTGVHHKPAVGANPRGHTSLLGAIDIAIDVMKPDDGGPKSWAVRACKFGPEGETNNFRLEPVQLGIDEDGDKIESLVVICGQPAEAAPRTARQRARLSDRGRIGLQALRDALGEHGQAPPPGLDLPYGLRVVAYDRWRSILERRIFDPDEKPTFDAVRVAVKRVGEELLSKGVIGRESPYVWIVREPN